MRCEMADGLLHGYLDGELDPVRAEEIERHLRACPDCADELRAQESLRCRLRDPGLYAAAPASLRRAVRERFVPASAVSGPAPPAARPGLRSRLATVAASILAAALGWGLHENRGEPFRDRVAHATLDAHLRSLQLARLTDVASTDVHTVKPWFVGRLSYSPPVIDFAADGFPLVGGRLDVVDGRTVAALVYAHRQHFVNVFVWPAEDTPDAAAPSATDRGYATLRFTHGGMEYWAVSDVAPADVEALGRLLRR
jgi:anti-sigma factor RsiW